MRAADIAANVVASWHGHAERMTQAGLRASYRRPADRHVRGVQANGKAVVGFVDHRLHGAEHIMWGSDYPHEEGFAPHSKLAIRWALHDRSEEDCRRILAGNAAQLYRIGLDALAPIASEIGPTVAEVRTL